MTTPPKTGWPPGMLQDEIRIAFEAWFSDEGLSPLAIERNGEGYRLMNAQQAWMTWKKAWTASRAAALEEAAQQIPTSWLDPLLTGPESAGPLPYNGLHVEWLMKQLAARVRRLIDQQNGAREAVERIKQERK